jgi:hypothetical protein
MDISRIREAIAQRQTMGEQEPKGKQEPKPTKVAAPVKPGLKFYAGGKEKTTTGMSNAFKDAGIDEAQVYKFAEEYGLPTGSNKEFQEATMALLEKTPAGKAKLAEIDSKYGETKAGTLADNMLGARTVDMMRGIIQNKAAQDEDNRITGLSKRFVRTPDGLEYSYGNDVEGFNEYMRTHKISDKAVRVQGEDLEKLKKRYPRLFNQEVDLQKFLKDNPGAYSN